MQAPMNRPNLATIDLRTWLRAIDLHGRTGALAAALRVPADGEPITRELAEQTDSVLEEAAMQANLRLFERRRFMNAVEQCRNAQPAGAAFPPPAAKQSVERVLTKTGLEEYADALAAHGLKWGDLSWAAQNDLEEAGMKFYHAKRLVRYIKKDVKFRAVDEEAVPPLLVAVDEGEGESDEDAPSSLTGRPMPGATSCEPEPEAETEPEPQPEPDDVWEGSLSRAVSERLRTGSGFVEPDELKAEDLEMTDHLLGEGQYGKVYAGVLLSHGKRESVAIKMMGAVDTHEVRAYEKEIATLRKVSKTCARVCRLYGTCVKDGKHCIVMKRYRSSLAAFLKEQPDRKMSTEQTMDYAWQISAALIELHEGQHQVVVQDLKPENVLIDENREAYLADFGISKVVNKTASIRQSNASVSNAMKGTLPYMSPESFDESKVTTFATDMWSLGCTLVELLAGEAPWAGLPQQQIMYSVCVHKKTPALPSGGHPGLCALIRKCFSYEPEDRPTARQFYDEAKRLRLLEAGSRGLTRIPFTEKEKRLLQWIKQDINLCDEGMLDMQAVEQAAKHLQVDSSILERTNSAVLQHLERAIIKATLSFEQDEQNPFRDGMFLSHYQVTGGPDVMLLGRLIEKACPPLKGKLWLDKDQTPTTEQMRLGVKRCTYFVLYLSRGVLLRPFVRMEIRWAILYRKKIRLVWPQDTEHAVVRFQEFFDDCAKPVPGAVSVAGQLDTDEIDIKQIFTNNVAIPYYKDEMFRNVSLAMLLEQCGFLNEAANLRTPMTVKLPEGLKIQLQYNVHNGGMQAEFVSLELQESLGCECCMDVKQQLDQTHGHLLIYVTKDVFAQPAVIAAVRQAMQFSRPITCLLETQEVHGGFSCTEYDKLPAEALHGAPADISATNGALLTCKVVPFYKDKAFRDMSLQVVMQSMQYQQPEVQLIRQLSPSVHGGNSRVRQENAGGGYGTCLDREFVQLEAGKALDQGKNIITVFEDDRRMAGFFDYDLAKAKYEGTRWVVLLHIDAVVYRRDKWEANAMINKIVDKGAGRTCSTKRNPMNEPGIWDFFLCYAQGTASDQAQIVAEMLRKAGKTVWLDMDMQDRSTDAMVEGVTHCKSFVLFLTADKRLFEPATPSEDRAAARGSDAMVEWSSKYVKQGELGSDRVSTVYRALDKRLQRVVAMKEFRPPAGRAFDEPQARALERASVIGSRVVHTNIAACYDYIMSPDSSKFCQTVELCDGPTLQQLLDTNGPMREAKAVAYLSGVCDGLDALHTKGVVHQYITLSNIRLSNDVPKILNFQLARAAPVTASDEERGPELGTLMLTDKATEVAGSPDYKSPEAWRGDGNTDNRTDIWSVGVCLFALLTGEMPFVVAAGVEKKHLIGEVLYKMDPAPDVREVITKSHAQPMDSRRPWQVSDATAAVVGACLKKEASSRLRSARVLKSQLDEAMAESGASEHDLVLSYAQPDEAAARQIYARLQNVLDYPVGPNKERLAVHLMDPASEHDDSVGRSTCFVPVVSTATLAAMSTDCATDAGARRLLARCQVATALSKLGLLEIVPVLCGDDDRAGSFHVPGSDGSGGPGHGAVHATVDEIVSSLKRSPRLRATNLLTGATSFHSTIARLLTHPAAVRMCEEDSDDSCARKLVRQVEHTKKVAAARKHRGLTSSMMVGVSGEREQDEAADFETSGDLDLYSDGSESLTSLPSAVPAVPEDIRDRVNYTDANVRMQLKEFAWFTKDAAMAIKLPPGVARDVARAKVLHHTQSVPAIRVLSVGLERLMSGDPTDLHSIVAGLDEPPIALVIDILDRAALPLSQIESAQAHRSPERYELLFDEQYKFFYVIAMLARSTNTATDSHLESSARTVVLETFVRFIESEHFQIRSGVEAMFAGTRDHDAIQRGVDSSTGKLLGLALHLVKVVGEVYKVRAQHSAADSQIFVLIAYLARAGTDQWRQEMRSQLESVLRDNPTLVQVARNCWAGTTGSADDRYQEAVAKQMALSPQVQAAEAERLVLFLEVQCSECTAASPGVLPGELSAAVMELFEARKAEFRRMAQLAVPAVALATEPRFCAGGVLIEREHATAKILQPLEDAGWRLLRPMRLLWAGERNLDMLAEGCDANTRALIGKVLDTVVERPPDRTRPDEIEDMSENVQEALGKMLVELQVAARLAVESPSDNRDRGRARLLQHVSKRFEAQQVQLYTPISRIFDGATDAQSLCAGLDHIDAAAVRKILSYVGNKEECLSTAWPKWEVLFGEESEPTKQTKDLIARREVEWKRIAQLAVPAVARATFPRFCDGGIEAEKATVNMQLIDDLERRGWCIREGIKRIWAGERDIHVVAGDADVQDTHILRHILSLVVESPDKVVRSAEREGQARRALRECDDTFRVAAKVATAPESYARQSDRDKLMAHVYGAVESRGLLLADPISRILLGQRDEVSLTEDLDDIDTECTQKILEYVRMIEEQGVSTDLWPTVDMLSAAPPNTQRFIDKHSRDGNFERIVSATTPDEQRHVTIHLLDPWEEGGWQVRGPVQRMWAGERREGAVVGTSDSNSAHIVRKLLSMFHTLEGGNLVTRSDTPYSSDVPSYDSVGCTRSSVSEGDVQTVMLVTGCDPEQARNCLDAAGGDAERAIDIFYGG